MKKSIFIFVILLFAATQILAQNNAPEVTNVTFSQRTDGSFMVDVYYDLNDVNGDTMFITMEVSEDSGATWNFSCDSVIGDVGMQILSGANRHIIWNFGVEQPQTHGDLFKIKIIADDGINIGTVTDIDNNVYQTIKIGNQWWMAQNLKVTHYQNGDAIPHVTDNGAWSGLSTGAFCNFNNNTANVATYGRLYNWHAVDDNRNIAPVGWHVPTDDEWKVLEMNLGMSQSQADSVGWRGTDEGGKLKEAGTAHWNSPNTGATNSSGFSALPGSHRSVSGNYGYLGYNATFWSTTEYNSSKTWTRDLDCLFSEVGRYIADKRKGISVRCVRANISFGISDIGTISSITSIDDENISPVKFGLDQNYPNPFNPFTTISFSLAKPSFVTLEIYSSLGEKIVTLVNTHTSAGYHEVKFDATNFASGIYYYRIQAGNFTQIKKMVVMK